MTARRSNLARSLTTLATLVIATTASAQDDGPTRSERPTCEAAGGQCMEGCELGHRDIGAHDCFDSTCCLPADQSTPGGVMSELFAAAQTSQFTALASLCDPVDSDGDVRRICDLATNPEGAESFVVYFGGGSVVGEATIDGDTATVEFVFGPSDSRSETMNLVQRDGAWYLQSF